MPTLDDAIDHLKRGKHEEGLKILQHLRERTPDDPDVLYNLGMTLSDMGLLEKATEVLKRCVELRGEANDHTALGVAYARAKEPEKAVAAFEDALVSSPDNFFALKNLGAVLGQLGRTDEAIAAFERAAKLDAGAPEVAYGLGHLYEKSGDIQRADEWYVKTLEIPGTSPVRDLAKESRTRIAGQGMKRHGANMAAVFYLQDAIQKYDGLSHEEVQKIAFDVALLGQRGLDINDPAKKYTLKSMPGEFSGLHLLCYMYAGFKIIDPNLDAGIDLGDEYEMAMAMNRGGEA